MCYNELQIGTAYAVSWSVFIFLDLNFEIRMVESMSDLSNTQFFKVQKDIPVGVTEVLKQVYDALVEKGYNPVNQIVGYVMSGDPTYITSHNNARSLIMKVERDEIVEELLREYISYKSWD
jgi:uncharacterized protein (UPF0297 family)